MVAGTGPSGVQPLDRGGEGLRVAGQRPGETERVIVGATGS